MGKDLASRFDEIQALIDDNRDAARVRMLEEIKQAQRQLANEDGQLGPWEQELLGQASELIKADRFLNLALKLIADAHEVHQLPKDDYEHGYNYTNR